LNYGIVLFNRGYNDLAMKLLVASESIYQEMDDSDKEPEMLEQREELADALKFRLCDA